MHISRGKSKTGPKNGLASMQRFLRSSKHSRGICKRTLPRTVPIQTPRSIRMMLRKNMKKMKKRKTHPIITKKTPLWMRRCVSKETGNEREKIPWR